MAITLEQLTEIIADVDPKGLVRAGAPRDEYAPEAREILTLVPPLQVTEITGVFTVMFDEPGACSRDDARQILEGMRVHDPRW